MKSFSTCVFVLAVLLMSVNAAAAQSRVRVRFARGASSSMLAGSIHGYAYKDYVVGAVAGQEMTVRLDPKTKAVFTIFRPDGENLEMAAETNEFNNTLSSTGDYVIRVLMMRSEARRRGSFANFRLTLSIK
jgi:hypothetical protein